jgi:hypothetical protein
MSSTFAMVHDSAEACVCCVWFAGKSPDTSALLGWSGYC